MRKGLITLCIVLLSGSIVSAQNVKVSHSSRDHEAPVSFQIPEESAAQNKVQYYTESKGKKNKSRDGQFPFVELGFNFLTPVDYGWNTEIPNFMDINNARSIYFGMYLFDGKQNLTRNGFLSLSAALGIYSSNLVFDKDYCISSRSGFIGPYAVDNAKKSKMTTFGIKVPVTLDFQIDKLCLSAGAYGGLALSSHAKHKFPKATESLDYVNLLQYGLVGQVNFKEKLGLFIYYPLNSLFEDSVTEGGNNPKTEVMTVGLGIIW